MPANVPQVNVVELLEGAEPAMQWLRSLGVQDVARARRDLQSIAAAGVTLDLIGAICRHWARSLPALSDADMAIANLERFILAARSPLALASLFERDADALPILLQIFSTSQYLSDLLVRVPENFDLLRITEGSPISRAVLVEDLLAEIGAVKDLNVAASLIRQFKHRETLRVAYGDIVRGQRIEVVTRQISLIAEAVCEAAVQAVADDLRPKYGDPRRSDGQESQFVVLGFGKLGGEELNYSSDIDLMFLYDEEGKTTGPKSLANSEYYARLCRGIVKLLTDTTEWGAAYRVDLRLRPEGKNGPIATSRVAAMHYYDVLGRTWERQALVKARPVAGDLEFGLRFLTELEPWIYRRYLTRADITGIKALKRRIEKQTLGAGTDQRNVKLGHGGIRDIEFVIQFLQLLNGGDLPELRTTNTLEAIMRLEQAGCLNMQERAILEENYALLRKIEHRLQIMLDLQTHVLPDNDRELKKVAIRAGFVDKDGSPALEQFKKTYREKTDLNRKILDHLLHDAFSDDQQTEPIVDLVLDPEPSSTSIAEVLGRYGFDDLDSAYKNLMELATECISFLSTRRCRHFLAAIAPQLLEEVSHTPAPDLTLLNLSQVSDSLGGKGVLWELFSWSSASLQLYVQLCAGSPYLSGILTSNPGMIDELMDSLVIDRLPASSWLRDSLTEMCRGAEETWQIVHGFKNSQHLRVGVRDILGKEDIRSTTAALSDIAEVCLQQVTSDEYRRLTLRHGEPRLRASAPDDPPPAWTTVSQRLLFGGDIDPLASGSGAASNSDAVGLPGDDDTCDFVILAMGKFGGREPNYHSDLDVIFLYEMEGMTGPTAKSRRADPTTNQHFFSQLGQRIIKTVNQLGPYGRLFELDARLRPTGKSGMLAVTFDEFHRYFAEGAAQLWERQSLCRARPIFGGATVRQRAMGIVRHAIVTPAWRAVDAQEIQQMRYRMEENASQHNLKRGPGGTVDIEFVVQMLQMRHGAEHPEIIVPNTLQAIDVLYNMHLMEQSDREALSRGYQTLRSVEARLRLMNTTARHDLPEDETSLAQLAYLLRRGSGQEVYDECRQLMADNRRLFKKMFREATGL